MAELDYLFLGSVGFLVITLMLIITRVVKLYIDEKRARERKEALRAMAADEHVPRNERDIAGKLWNSA